VTGSGADFAAWQRLYGELADLAAVVAPALSGPLRARTDVRDAVIGAAGPQIWADLAEAPIGEMITRRFGDDVVRGVVATDALIGTHTSLFDPGLAANRCFLYHLIGRGTGEWLVPVGGMGALADALITRALAAGVELRCGIAVDLVRERDEAVWVHGQDADGTDIELEGAALLAAVAPATLGGWLGRTVPPPVGAQMKINMLLDRLPRLASGIDPDIAFAGTTHLEEGFADSGRGGALQQVLEQLAAEADRAELVAHADVEDVRLAGT
jgi:phytoene dehydrogenase-like protein